MKMKAARDHACGSIREIIALGKIMASSETRQYMQSSILPDVCENMEPVHFRVQMCYALVLTVAKLISC
jgi:hypothetical protein